MYERFHIWKYWGNGIVKDNSLVYLKRKDCSVPYVSGKDGWWVETHDYHGTCEDWIIKRA